MLEIAEPLSLSSLSSSTSYCERVNRVRSFGADEDSPVILGSLACGPFRPNIAE